MDYEEFTPEQIKILERYVTNTSGSVFVLRNLPEVIKGALFSRYSRSTLGLRSLLLKEFISNSEETGFAAMSGAQDAEGMYATSQLAAIKKAQSFYDRILDGYGDDSIGELGGAHIAIENVSLLAAKAIEDSRIGGSPLEKSTRYMYFDQKVKGEYLFYREPILMTSAYKELYISTCNRLFDTYSKLIPPLTAFMEARNPKDAETSKAAYAAALRAKVLDCLRGILPASTLTNMGLFGNGRFFEYMIHKLLCNNLAEIQDLGKRCYEELYKVIPSFIRRAEITHKSHKSFAQFYEAQSTELKLLRAMHAHKCSQHATSGAHLVSFDAESVYKVAAMLLFAESQCSLEALIAYVKKLPEEDLGRILDAAAIRDNRRQKSPRALEQAVFTFEIVSDFGCYRDLHRHRILSQERQLLCCNYGYVIPPEIAESKLDEEYREAMDIAREAYDAVAKELPEEAQYIVPMAYNIRWYFTVNLRALQWLCELRSSPAGHPAYRLVAQELASEVMRVLPQFERFFKFVDFDGYDLGRLGQEQRKAEKLGLE